MKTKKKQKLDKSLEDEASMEKNNENKGDNCV